jgi:hypothetical protein
MIRDFIASAARGQAAGWPCRELGQMRPLEVSPVERALIVVRAFMHQQPELSLTDASAATRLREATEQLCGRRCSRKAGLPAKDENTSRKVVTLKAGGTVPTADNA